ncbi:MAG: hypothetical protein R3B55_01900 [Candidatus Paceibacterota bacterium]
MKDVKLQQKKHEKKPARISGNTISKLSEMSEGERKLILGFLNQCFEISSLQVKAPGAARRLGFLFL